MNSERAVEATSPVRRRELLDPVDRVSEIIFGLIMVLTFTGTVSATDHDRVALRSLIASAIGCNIAWGLVDAVMYLMSIVTERAHGTAATRSVSEAPQLHTNDYLAAVAVFLWVFVSTLPVVIPFIFIHDVGRALRFSNAVAIAMLFLCGYSLGQYASLRPIRTGVAMSAIGIALVAITMALGG
jgi:VIT1/CCC1 family predicted Fe2+/Mn2+ transporter